MSYRVTTIGGMGDASDPGPVGTAVDPALKAKFLALAPTMPDDRAADLAEIVDATPYGSRQRWIRYGLGALAGAAIGVLVLTPISGYLMTRRR